MPTSQQTAQIVSDTASQFLQAGMAGITLFALIVTLAAIVMVFVVIRFLTRRSDTERELLRQASEANAQLAVTIREEYRKGQESRDKQVDAVYKQTESNDKLNTTMRSFLEKQSLQEDTLDKMNLNILTVVNGFGAVNEGIGRIEKAVQDNPTDHQTVLDVVKKISEAQDKLFTLIDSRLPERSKIDTPPLMNAAAPSAELLKLKRDTNQVKAVKPEDADPPLKPTG